MNALTHATIETNGIKLHYVTAGEGPPVLLLHGFPQDWYTWRHQIPVLAQQFKVIAPDLRGYGTSDKPQNVSDYRLSTIAEDIKGLLHALNIPKASIVGHDWGGAVAWRLALDHPEIIDRLVVLNSPHPKIFAHALRHNYKQMRKSWYIFLFQLPYIPEFMFKMDPKKALKKILRGSAVNKEAFNEADIQHYLESFQKPETITAALNYYRAALRSPSKDINKKITVPTLLIWGEEDQALGKELTYGMDPLFTQSFRIHYIPQCSHWVQEEQPALVNQLLIDWLTT